MVQSHLTTPFADLKNGPLIVLLSLLVSVTLAEMLISNWGNKKYYQKQDTLNNIYLSTITFFINLLVKGSTFYILNFFYAYRFFEIKNIFLYWLALIVLQDLLYWILHYVGHVCRFFWAIHVTHHSSAHFNITTGFRSTVFEPLYRVVFYIPLAFMGFSALNILYAYLVTQLYGNLVHTQLNIKLPKWYSFIFVTPAHHRVHHASNIPYLDKNMGMVFILWDRLFGTFRDEDPNEKPQYGLTKPLEKQSPTNIIFHEWRSLKDVRTAVTWRDKLKYLFYPPGWSHDGSTQTSRVLQKALKEKNDSVVSSME